MNRLDILGSWLISIIWVLMKQVEMQVIYAIKVMKRQLMFTVAHILFDLGHFDGRIFFLQSMCNPAEPITRLYKETHHHTRNLHLSGLSWECLWFHTHAVKSANKRQIYCQSTKSIFLVPEVPSFAMILPDSRDCPIFLRDEMTG